MGERYLGQMPEVLQRASCGFGGGVGGCREELCGALSGGVLILGALFGRLDYSVKDDPFMAQVKVLRERFIAALGHTQCNPIRDRRPDVPKRCGDVVREGARLAVEAIEEYRAAQ